QAEDGIRYRNVTGVQTCALPILRVHAAQYPLGAECVLPDAMSAHVDANHLVVLRDNQSSSAAPLLSDRSFGRVLPDLSFLGGKQIGRASCRERVWSSVVVKAVDR